VHHSVVCVSCGRCGGTGAAALYAKHATAWLGFREGSFGREARNAANILHAAAKIGAVDGEVLSRVANEAARLSRDFNSQNAANSLWSCATLGVSDASIVRPLSEAAARLAPSRDFNSQCAANCLWSCATLGVSDASIVRPLAEAAARLAPSREIKPQEVANSLWSCAKLGVSDASILRPLAEAAARLASSFKSEEARAVLQAHFAGVPLDAACIASCWRTLRASPDPPLCTSALQRSVAAALTRLGFTAALETPVLDGLLHVDITATAPSGARTAVEVDGPSHFLRLLSSDDKASAVGPPDGATVLRNILLRSAAAGFDGALVVVRFDAWDECRGDAAREDALLRAALAPGVASCA
jgi:hypothetical protein